MLHLCANDIVASMSLAFITKKNGTKCPFVLITSFLARSLPNGAANKNRFLYTIKAENLFDISPILVAFRLFFFSLLYMCSVSSMGETPIHTHTHSDYTTIWLLHCKMRLILFKISCEIEYIILRWTFRLWGSGLCYFGVVAHILNCRSCSYRM